MMSGSATVTRVFMLAVSQMRRWKSRKRTTESEQPAVRVRHRNQVCRGSPDARDLTPFTADIDYRTLPPAFHRYFEDDVQPLERAGPDRCWPVEKQKGI